MAERKRKYQTEKTKEKIRDSINTRNVIDKLQAHLNDEIEMKGTQIKAAEVLLARTLPVLSSNENINKEEPTNLQELVEGLREMAGDNADEVLRLLGIEETDSIELEGNDTQH